MKTVCELENGPVEIVDLPIKNAPSAVSSQSNFFRKNGNRTKDATLYLPARCRVPAVPRLPRIGCKMGPIPQKNSENETSLQMKKKRGNDWGWFEKFHPLASPGRAGL